MGSGSARLRRAERLRDARDYRRLAAEGSRAMSNNFVLLATHNRPGAPRLGITTSRRVGGSVERNRVKRLIREWFRRAKGSLPGDLELVVIARSGAVALSQQEAGQELDRLVERARR